MQAPERTLNSIVPLKQMNVQRKKDKVNYQVAMKLFPNDNLRIFCFFFFSSGLLTDPIRAAMSDNELPLTV